jgi:hypothetical protein
MEQAEVQIRVVAVEPHLNQVALVVLVVQVT